MLWIKNGMENPSKSEVIGRCGGDENTDWPCTQNRQKSNAKKMKFLDTTMSLHFKVYLITRVGWYISLLTILILINDRPLQDLNPIFR